MGLSVILINMESPVPMRVAVRQMQPEDAEAVAALSCQLGYPATAADVSRRLASMERHPDARVFVAQASNAQIVGWIHIYATCLLESDADAEIGGLVVAEEARGRGVGGILLAAAERWAAELAYPAVRVRSNILRVQARGFYEHLGYEHIKTQNNFRKALTLSSRDSRGSKRQEAT